jgi:carboxymethylenebutenolidase
MLLLECAYFPARIQWRRRRTMQEIVTHDVTIHVTDVATTDEVTMEAFVARPGDEDIHPALIVLQEAFGVNSHVRDVTQRFAREGYVTIAPELYHRTAQCFTASYTDFASVMPHMKALTEEGLTADLRATFGWLTSNDFVRADAIASVGFCLGGRVSFLATATLPLKAAVSFYGGGIAPSATSPGLLHHCPNLRAPILMFWGGKDQHIPPDQRRAVADALLAADKRFVYVAFSDADHGFFNDERPSYNASATKLAWVMMEEFFRENIG